MIVRFVDVVVFLVFRIDCLFYRCRGLSCVQDSVRMIDDYSFCRCRGLSCVQGVLLG